MLITIQLVYYNQNSCCYYCYFVPLAVMLYCDSTVYALGGDSPNSQTTCRRGH